MLASLMRLLVRGCLFRRRGCFSEVAGTRCSGCTALQQ